MSALDRTSFASISPLANNAPISNKELRAAVRFAPPSCQECLR